MKFFSILIIITQFFISVAFANDATTSVVKTPEFVCKEYDNSGNENYSELKVYFISRYPKEWNGGVMGLYEVSLTSKMKEYQNEVKYYFDENIQDFFQDVKARSFFKRIGADKSKPTHTLSILQHDQATLQLNGSDRLEKFNCAF